MTPITEFESAGMSELQYLEECHDRNFTYQDYFTNCEILRRSPCSKRLYEAHMATFTERQHAASLR